MCDLQSTENRSIEMSSYQPASPKCQLHRVSIHGDKGDFLILGHGFGSDQTGWERVLPFLTKSHRVMLFDIAGSGANGAQSFDPRRHVELEAFTDDLLQILQELGIKRCSYVGHSVSGMIGGLASIERPDLFRQLIFVGASPRYLNDGDYIGGFDQPSLDGLYAAMSSNYHGWVSGFAPIAVGGLPESEAVADFSQTLFALRPDIALATVRTIFQSDMRDRLSFIETPTTVIQMRNDIAVPMAVGEYLAKHIARSTMNIIPAEGHLPQLSAPGILAEALQQHLLQEAA